MGKAIGIIAIKGGVGKTTIATSLAADLAQQRGKRVLLVDANYSAPNVGLHMDIVTPHKTIHEVLAGKARFLSAVHHRHGVDVVPGSYVYQKEFYPLRLRDKVERVKHLYDFVVIDGSPSLNDELLSTMLASDVLFVVSTPDYPTLSCSLSAARLARQRGKPIAGIIINKVRNPAYELALQDIESTMELPVVARIPDERFHVRALYLRTPAAVYKKSSRFAREISALSAALTAMPEQRTWWSRVFSRKERKEAVNRQILKEKLYKSVFEEWKNHGSGES